MHCTGAIETLAREVVVGHVSVHAWLLQPLYNEVLRRWLVSELINIFLYVYITCSVSINIISIKMFKRSFVHDEAYFNNLQRIL